MMSLVGLYALLKTPLRAITTGRVLTLMTATIITNYNMKLSKNLCSMEAKELLDKALYFIVETQEENDYICEQMCEEYVGDYCEKNCQNLNKECVKLFLQKVYNKA